MAASGRLIFLGIVVMLFAANSFGQLPSSRCDAISSTLADCNFVTRGMRTTDAVSSETMLAAVDPFDAAALRTQSSPTQTASQADNGLDASTIAPAPKPRAKEGFHWGAALRESFTFLAIEHAYVVKDDFRWVVAENGIPFNHYWRDYKQSISEWVHSGWSDGDPNMYGYVGHPIQGALTSYIEIQNDPKSENLEFANTKEYWRSRFKATLWNAVYSTQWNLGPISEVTVEKYGTKARPPWNQDGSWPCTRKPCLTGVGQIDIVMTPVGGFGWMVAEDWLDKNIARRVEGATSNRFLIDTVRCAFNPTRAGASMLHGRAPWFRMRDRGPTNLLAQNQSVSSLRAAAPSVPAATMPPIPDRGNLFAGYSYTNSDVVAGHHSGLSGWDLAVEKKYLHFFGLVGDISGQYGSPRVPANGTCQNGGGSAGGCIITSTRVSQLNYLAGIRGGHSVWRIRPFAQVMVGAVHTRETAAGVSSANTGFTADLAAGVDLRLVSRVGWRMQADYLTTGTFVASQHNVRLSIGPAIRF
jgi:hypothetical protein